MLCYGVSFLTNTIKNCWITLNRQCNLRCKWCYAAGTKYKSEDEMDIKDFLRILDFLNAQNIKKVTLMGGEPTCYNNLLKAINLCNEHGIDTVLVTNGIKLADANLVMQLQQAGLTRLNLSLKGYDNNDFMSITGVDGFHIALAAIKNISESDIPFTVSMVLSSDNIHGFIKGVTAAKAAGAEHFSFSFRYDFSVLNNKVRVIDRYDFEKNIFGVIDEFINQYSELCKVLKNNFTLAQSFPLCAWPEEFIMHMASKLELRSVCQLLRHSGLIFDIDFRVIPCNAMYQISLGKFGEDFNSSDFGLYWNSARIKEIFNKLRSVPSIKCNSCKWLNVCGGGCVSHWFNFTFEEFEQARDFHFANKA